MTWRILRRKRRKPTQKYIRYKEEARTLVRTRLEHFNMHYGYAYARIAIKDHRSRWGSCSKKGNLNFNYRIALLPPDLADYVVLHELCHLGEFNHSPHFWALLARTMPDWPARRTALMRINVRN